VQICQFGIAWLLPFSPSLVYARRLCSFRSPHPCATCGMYGWSQVVFSDYEVGRVYSRLVKVRNLTQVVRSLRLLPPASQYFHMSLPRMPQDNSCIAPGMAAEVRQGAEGGREGGGEGEREGRTVAGREGGREPAMFHCLLYWTPSVRHTPALHQDTILHSLTLHKVCCHCFIS
jgi:hypothetical protein